MLIHLLVDKVERELVKILLLLTSRLLRHLKDLLADEEAQVGGRAGKHFSGGGGEGSVLLLRTAWGSTRLSTWRTRQGMRQEQWVLGEEG